MIAHPLLHLRALPGRVPPRARMRRALASVVATLLLVVGVASVGTAQSSRAPAFSIERGSTLEIVHESGSIFVRGIETDRVQVRSEDNDARFRVTGSSRARRLSSTRRSGDLFVDVPIGTPLLIRTRSGDINVRDTGADVEIRSTSGDVEIAKAAQVRVESVTGDLEVSDITDGLRLNTTSGDIVIGTVRGDLEVTGSSSEVFVLDATSRRVAIKVLSGDITFAGVLDDAGRYDFSSHSGDVVLRLPNGSRAAIDVQTYNGELSSSDLPLVLMPDLEPGEENDRLMEMRRSRDSLERFVRDSLRSIDYDRPDRFRNRRDSVSFERNLERSVEQLVESLVRNIGAQIESLSNSFDKDRNGRSGKVTRVQLGDAGGPLITISTFSGDVELQRRSAARRRR